ncbi:MAG: ATP-binding protein [Pseudomonadales bacterium]
MKLYPGKIVRLLAVISLLAMMVTASGYPIDPEQDKQLVEGVYHQAVWSEMPEPQLSLSQQFFVDVLRPGFEAQVLAGVSSSAEPHWQEIGPRGLQVEPGQPFTWVTFPLTNTARTPEDFVLQLEGIGIVAWHVVNDAGEVFSHVDDLTKVRSGRPVFDTFPIIPLEFAPGEEIRVYVGIYGSVSVLWNFILWQESAFLQDRQQNMMLDGIYFGLVLTLLLFCLVVFFNIREPVYLFFGLFLASSAAMVFFASGLYTLFLFENYIGWGLVYLFFATAGVDIFGAIFTILLLRVHLLDRPLYFAWLGIMSLNLINLVYGVLLAHPDRIIEGDSGLVLGLSATTTVLEQIIFLWTLIAFWRSSVVARYWFLVIFSVSATTIFWTIHSVYPEITDLEPKRVVQSVMLLGAVLLCVVLAYTYRVERSERLVAQDMSVENLRLARDIEQAKANFISTVSHDLHGPVRAIGFFAEALRGKTADEEAAINVQRIEENVETVSALLDSLVRLSEVEAHRQLAIEEVPLARVLYTLKNEFEPVARGKNLQLEIPSSELTVQSDQVALSQILRNLIENAIKYTDKGSIKLEVDEMEQFVSIAVIDTGLGIAQSDLIRVFDEFFQVSGSDSDGVGLGLSIVARLTHLLGIKIRVSSKPGKGSRFELQLAKDPAVNSSDRPITQAFASGLNLTALVIDEADDKLTAVADYLDDWGVRLESELTDESEADFLLVPGTVEGLRWLNQHWREGTWVLVVGEAQGFTAPNEKVVLLPVDVEPMRLRAVIQRILSGD